MPLFSFTNIPWTPVITTFIQHQSCFFQGLQITRQFWWTGMQRSSKAHTTAVWLLYLCKTPSLSTLSKWIMLYLSSTGFDWILTLSLETVFTKSTNKLWRWLLQLHVSPWCVELEYILAPLLILFTGNSSTPSIELILGPIAPILLVLRFANWGLRHTFPLNTK